MKRSAFVALLVALVACGGSSAEVQPPTSDGKVLPGQTVSLVGLVSSVSGSATVAWSMASTGGGTVDQSGDYTAPSCAQLLAAVPSDVSLAGLITGTDTVVATWSGGSLSIPITISEAVVSVTVSPSTASLAPGGTTQFTATVNCTCHSYTAG